MKKLFRLAVILTVVLAGIAIWILNAVDTPYKGFADTIIVDLPRGTSTSKMAEILASKGVIQHPWKFMASRVIRRGARLQAGEYKFDKELSASAVFDKIVRGDIYYLELLIPEGFNMFEIAAAVAKLGVISEQDFLAQAHDPALIHDLDPAATSLEGYLFPNKYRVYPHTTAHDLCRNMTSEFRARWQALQAIASLHETLTLASLVEREARLPEERATVASVFQNRLRIGMKLDCDPTTVYAALLEDRYRGTIHQSDLASESPYNTYRHAGLPPGPIANPGLDAIKAALNPDTTAYLYFVAKADGTGGHEFSESLAQHNSAVERYHRAIHQRQ